MPKNGCSVIAALQCAALRRRLSPVVRQATSAIGLERVTIPFRIMGCGITAAVHEPSGALKLQDGGGGLQPASPDFLSH